MPSVGVNPMRKRPLRVYMCDLTHDTIVLVSDTIPINIGFIGAYAKKMLGDDIETPYTTAPLQSPQSRSQSTPGLRLTIPTQQQQ